MDNEQIYGSEIHLSALPTQNYRRKSLQDKVDVVVRVGGVLGLFIGVSVLSLMEIFYYFFVRIFHT